MRIPVEKGRKALLGIGTAAPNRPRKKVGALQGKKRLYNLRMES